MPSAGYFGSFAEWRVSSDCSHSTRVEIAFVMVCSLAGWCRIISTIFLKVSGKVVVRWTIKIL